MDRIAIIGAGNVGGALYCALRKSLGDEGLVLCDRAQEQLTRVNARHATHVAADAVSRSDTVVIAVKPQSFAGLADSLPDPLGGRLVVTVMAGVQIATVASALGAASVVRAMPNLGTQVDRGVTAWIAAPACDMPQRALARRILAAAGAEIEVGEESLLDAFTALGGSGPAYFFYLTELLAENAVRMGFDAGQARLLAREVLSASARLLESGERSPAEWRRAVTTPGGTTEAAMRSFAANGFADDFRAGLEAARDRSAALNRG
jgi:pyrroline-5-carboxylate reductase